MKHSNYILMFNSPLYYSRATLQYLKETYPRYEFGFLTNEYIEGDSLSGLKPKLLILPGGRLISKELSKKSLLKVKDYAQTGGNIMTICAANYIGTEYHYNYSSDNTLTYGKNIGHPILPLFNGGTLSYTRKSGPTINESFSRTGKLVKSFYYNGPFFTTLLPLDQIKPDHEFASLEKTTPLLYFKNDNGKPSKQKFSLLATELPNGGAAVMSTNHNDHPFEYAIKVEKKDYQSIEKLAQKGKITKKRLAKEFAYLATLESLKPELEETEPESQSIRNFVYENVFSLKR